MNTTVAHEILFTAAEAAKIAGVEESTLRAFEPSDFGSPGHWRMVSGKVVYTLKGLSAIAVAMEASTEDLCQVAGVCLRVEVKKRTETPAAELPSVSGAGRPWYQGEAGGMA